MFVADAYVHHPVACQYCNACSELVSDVVKLSGELRLMNQVDPANEIRGIYQALNIPCQNN